MKALELSRALSSLPLPSSNPAIQPVISRVHLSSSSPLSLTSLLISCITLWCYLIDLSDNQTGLQLSLSLPSLPLSLFILGNWLALMNYPAQHVSVYIRPHTEQGVCFRAPGEQIQTLQWVCVCAGCVHGGLFEVRCKDRRLDHKELSTLKSWDALTLTC